MVANTIKEHYTIVFNGNGYSQEWIEEAARRGLPNLATAPQALAVYDAPKNIEAFVRTGVLSSEELKARTSALAAMGLAVVGR